MSTFSSAARGAIVPAMLAWAIAAPAIADEFATKPEAEAEAEAMSRRPSCS
ncbi:hypothetical protein [Massilia pseudoviolaceinigra]|uniref:hypothetical protein n=1 Tax=Massilia pseudoviolaceinigra TaxID=3057165 RepID=UPI002796DE43|nr:hypothetical protein [Massilia sp. CCM 9206]MDQ1924056.1 hypothetical protein [Massilia sp. CCM 9206]